MPLKIGSLFSRVFGSANERHLKRYRHVAARIGDLEPAISGLSDQDLAAKTLEFRRRLEKGETLDSLLPEAFAVVREAAFRVLGQRPFDVQLIGGMVLHDGRIAEMRTGEGKTLVATLPSYLNALAGKGVHVVTVNDYLARRDCEWMGQIHRFLGLTVGCITHGLSDGERRENYGCDITYGTNNEFGFDYLRDNMKYHLKEMVQRGHAFAVVDEVDSILIDEARTPLIISGAMEDTTSLYLQVEALIPTLSPEHYEKDEKARQVQLTEAGNQYLEDKLCEIGLLENSSLYDAQNAALVHHITQALRAHVLFTRDKEYIVKDQQVIIIDEFTGRMMPGRRYSDGLHQAIEAKERVPIQPENQTLASITFQNYFRLYDKLSGMTGTAATEADEFSEIYGLDVVQIPTNLPIKRQDDDDVVYRTSREKYIAILELIEECHGRGQPVLVGTTSIEKSESLSARLKDKGIPHHVLNARYHEQEAHIIAQAGALGAVTIATNMAGRGTDIQLGGHSDMRIRQELEGLKDGPESSVYQARAAEIRAHVAEEREKVLQAGGLFVIGTERHESRRIDNQLRGRSGRQGDEGRSRFFLALDDDLMRIFGSERMDGMLRRLGLQEGEAIVHPWINKAIEKAQQKVEARHFDARKNLLKFDNVMNDQRKVIFDQRISLMRNEDIFEVIETMGNEVLEDLVEAHIRQELYAEQWESAQLRERLQTMTGVVFPIEDWVKEEGIAEEEILSRVQGQIWERYHTKRSSWGDEMATLLERQVLLQSLDHLWREHLVVLEHLRRAVGLRGYAQRDPLNEYRTEAFHLFEGMLGRLREMVFSQLMRIEMVDTVRDLPHEEELPELLTSHEDPTFGEETGPFSGFFSEQDPFFQPESTKVGRNDPCPCGSGKKFKHCHGVLV